MKNKQQKLQDDLQTALWSQPFPVRGWHLSMHFATGCTFAYPVHNLGLIEYIDEVPKDKPEILFEVASQEMVLTADFRLEACRFLGGQPWQCPPLVEEQQWIRFAAATGDIEITLDSKLVPPFQERVIYPDATSWRDSVEKWSKVWAENKDDTKARWILVQLNGIRDSGNSLLMQALQRLVLRIEQSVPDYWMFAEMAMAGLLNQAQIDALNKYELGKGAITVSKLDRSSIQ